MKSRLLCYILQIFSFSVKRKMYDRRYWFPYFLFLISYFLFLQIPLASPWSPASIFFQSILRLKDSQNPKSSSLCRSEQTAA